MSKIRIYEVIFCRDPSYANVQSYSFLMYNTSTCSKSSAYETYSWARAGSMRNENPGRISPLCTMKMSRSQFSKAMNSLRIHEDLKVAEN